MTTSKGEDTPDGYLHTFC